MYNKQNENKNTVTDRKGKIEKIDRDRNRIYKYN